MAVAPTSTAHQQTQEKITQAGNGGLMLLVLTVLFALSLWGLIAATAGSDEDAVRIIVFAVALTLVSIGFGGFYTLQPNEAAVITLFGNYKGTDRTSGLRWVFPWYKRQKISL